MSSKMRMTGSVARHLLVGALGLLWLSPPAGAASPFDTQEKAEAAKVARKVEKARSPKHQAKKDLEAVEHFQKQVAKYARVHDNQVARLGRQRGVTAQALAEAIAADRSKARQGDIFLLEVQPLFRRLIAEQLKGPDTQAARKAVVEGNPGEEEGSVAVVPRVNSIYPPGATRSTVPASLLLTLPPLPECLHYRFLGRDLILLDADAQIIVDFLPTAAPTLGGK